MGESRRGAANDKQQKMAAKAELERIKKLEQAAERRRKEERTAARNQVMREMLR